MSVERQWGTLAMMHLLKKEPAMKEGDGRITMAVATSPKPPKAPSTTFARDPRSSSQSLLGGGKDIKGKDPQRRFRRARLQRRSRMARSKRRTQREIPQRRSQREKAPKEKKEKERNAPRR